MHVTGKLVETDKKTNVSLEWPTLILQGEAVHGLTGTVVKRKTLIDPSSPPEAKQGKGGQEVVQCLIISMILTLTCTATYSNFFLCVHVCRRKSSTSNFTLQI